MVPARPARGGGGDVADFHRVFFLSTCGDKEERMVGANNVERKRERGRENEWRGKSLEGEACAASERISSDYGGS